MQGGGPNLCSVESTSVTTVMYTRSLLLLSAVRQVGKALGLKSLAYSKQLLADARG